MQHTVKNIATHGIALAVAIVLRFLLELFSVYAYGTSQDGAFKMYLNESPQVT